MKDLLLSILLNAYLGIVFVHFNRLKIDLFQAIVFNYITCVLTGSLISGHFPVHSGVLQESWFRWAMVMGSMFIVVFNIIALSSVKAGATVTQTSNKLSLVIPVLFSIYLYDERLSILKWAGIAIALIAIFCTINKKDTGKTKEKSKWVYILPLLLFAGSGIIDTLTKYAEDRFLTNERIANDYLISGFFVAAAWGSLVLGVLYLTGKKTFEWRNLIAGIVLGIPNYFSIFYFIKALGNGTLSSSAVIPINNIGILLLVTLYSAIILKEKMQLMNYIGIVLTVISILMIFWGD